MFAATKLRNPYAAKNEYESHGMVRLERFTEQKDCEKSAKYWHGIDEKPGAICADIFDTLDEKHLCYN